MLTQLDELIKDSGKLSATRRAELRGVISTRPGLNRYLRVTPGGLLRADAAKIKAEENLDGKYLLRTSDPKLAAGDIALGYKQLLEAERGWHDLKQAAGARGLAFNEDKTKIVRLNEGFDFLGFGIRRYPNGKQPITSGATATTR
jgi:hypothetical protein